MINPNANHHLQPVSDNYWTVDTIKAIVEHPGFIPSHVFANVHFDSALENDFTLQFLKDVYNPPDGKLHLSQMRLQELHSMRLKNRYQQTPLTREGPKKPDLVWNNNQEDPMMRMMNRNFANVPNKSMQRAFPPPMNSFVPIMTKNRPPFYNRPDPAYNQKRKDMNPMYDISRKNFRGTRNAQTKNVPKGPNFIDLVDEELETSLPEKKVKRDNKLLRNRHLARTGLNKNKTNTNPIEILDSPDLDEAINQTIPPINCEFAQSEEPSQFEEEKAELTTSTVNLPAMEEQNEQDGDITNENSKAETFEDAFDFNIEDLGIKILGEVFLCNRCQKQISQRDADKGFKETCPSCQKAMSKASKKNQQAAQAEAAAKSKQVQAATSTQATKEKMKEAKETKETKEVKEPEKEPMKEIEKYWMLAPLYQSRNFYEETSLTDILDPKQRQKNTPISRHNQIGYMPLTLYNTSSGRKTRKLWKPDRLNDMTYEKFKDEVNTKNGIHLIDEEVTEILVRHKYDVEAALEWSSRSNPDFQYYLKRSSNRKRLITRGTGKNY